jgi:2',3'-cyclic-nucleotide 2'-phosphodiesterase (5'-nucleotidase family)
LYEAIENSVSKWPSHEGRFPQISGFGFSFDGEAPAGSRVDVSSIKLASGKKFSLKERYTFATSSYIAKGGDGFTSFKNENVKNLTDADNHLWIIDILESFFKRTSTEPQDEEKGFIRDDKYDQLVKS